MEGVARAKARKHARRPSPRLFQAPSSRYQSVLVTRLRATHLRRCQHWPPATHARRQSRSLESTSAVAPSSRSPTRDVRVLGAPILPSPFCPAYGSLTSSHGSHVGLGRAVCSTLHARKFGLARSQIQPRNVQRAVRRSAHSRPSAAWARLSVSALDDRRRLARMRSPDIAHEPETCHALHRARPSPARLASARPAALAHRRRPRPLTCAAPARPSTRTRFQMRECSLQLALHDASLMLPRVPSQLVSRTRLRRARSVPRHQCGPRRGPSHAGFRAELDHVSVTVRTMRIWPSLRLRLPRS